MKIPAIIPAGLCATAGVLLAGDALCAYLWRDKSEFDVLSFSIGLYFIGKGLFIHSVLTMLCDIKQNR
jgi:hypothetical protein